MARGFDSHLARMENKKMRLHDYKCCPKCVEPLVTSLAVRQMEWVCMVCGSYYPFLGGRNMHGTDELQERWLELSALKKAGTKPGDVPPREKK